MLYAALHSRGLQIARRHGACQPEAGMCRRMHRQVVSFMSGTPGIGTGPNLPCGPEPCSGAGGAYRCYLEAEAQPGAVPAARRAARQALAAWGLDHVAPDAELVLSELLTNAVQATLAAAPPADVVAAYLALDLDRLFVLVWDSST